MGEKLTKAVEQPAEGNEDKGNGRQDNRNSGTETGKTGTAAGRKTSGGRKPAAGKETGEEKGLSLLVDVNQKEPLEIEVDKSGEMKPKPKKKKAVRKAKKDNATADQLSVLLVTLSAIAAARPGWEHWAITAEEAKSIAIPLCDMIEKSEAFSKVAEHSEALALVAAVTVVVLPRVMITVTQQKEKSDKKKLAQKGVTITDEQVRKIDADNRANVTDNANNGKDDGSSLYSAIPPLA